MSSYRNTSEILHSLKGVLHRACLLSHFPHPRESLFRKAPLPQNRLLRRLEFVRRGGNYSLCP